MKGTFRRRTVLLVEDDPVIRQMYALGLDAAGYEVTAVADGAAALAALSRGKRDVAILDWDLPAMRGDELFELIRGNRITQEMPVMFLSNYRQSQTKIAGAVMGGSPVPWLVKVETTPAELARRVGQLIGSLVGPTTPTAA